MKTNLFIVSVVVAILFFCGCQSKPSGKFDIANRRISIITEPQGAMVKQKHVLGQPSTNLGVTPIIDQPIVVITRITKMNNMPYVNTQQLMKASGGNVMVHIEKDGYHPYNGVLETKAGETLTHKITLQGK